MKKESKTDKLNSNLETNEDVKVKTKLPHTGRLFTAITIFIVSLFINVVLFVIVFLKINNTHTALIILQVINAIILVISIFVALNIICNSKYSYNKLLWLTLIFFQPLFGIIMYAIFARDYKRDIIETYRPIINNKTYLDYEVFKNQEIDDPIFSYLHHNTGRSVFMDNTKTTILTNGDQKFPVLINKLLEANESIFMSYYIIQNDNIANKVLNILKDKARQGVKVKLLFDAMGTKHIKHKKVKELREAGIKVAIFERLIPMTFFNAVNFRNHRKITVIDGKYAFTGGLNLGDEYNHQSKKYGFWRDTHIMVEGIGVTSLANIFAKDWYYTTGEWELPNFNYETYQTKGLVCPVESGPDHKDSIIKKAYLKMIYSAKKSIYITTPYMMLEPDVESALIIAAKSGIDVKIVLPGKPDKFLVNQATKSYYEQLLDNGIEIYEYIDTFVHAKVLIIDEETASIGTCNFDPRSFNINFECTVFLKNDSVDHLVADFKDDINHSRKIDPDEWKHRSIFKRIIQGIMGLFSPLI